MKSCLKIDSHTARFRIQATSAIVDAIIQLTASLSNQHEQT